MGMFNDFRSPAARPAPVAPATAPAPVPAPARAPQPARPVARAEAAPVPTDWLDLKHRLHETILEEMNLSALETVDTKDMRRAVATLTVQHLAAQKIELGSDGFKQLVSDLIDEVTGLGPLEPLLADPTISDILVNGHSHVFVERKGLLERAPSTFRDEKHLLRIIDKIVSRVGRRIDESQPWVDARLPDGSRVNAIIRPCAIDGPSLSIRKFSADKLTMDRLVGYGAITTPAAQFLRAAVEARMNVLISGGTGSGKTTMLNALSACIDRRQRIVTIEDAAELQLQQEHVVRLETRPSNTEGAGEISQRLLVKNALRMRPDRIVIGEVRGSEAFDMLQAMNTGHDGSMTTIHANTARDAISRLEQMVVMIGADFPLSAVRNQIASGINIVLQLNRLSDGSRRVMSISEVYGLEGDTILMQDIFIFKREGRDAEGNVLGRFLPTGVRPRCYDLIMAAGIPLPTDVFSGLSGRGVA
ncbi:CpaF family protein [uncultured Maritimibacter sp.]|jgi:pilus assembly protein CpaF|uniref:CpaF family protein n=1 Tax=uncultured Maritimibacter sp. TaxID=991866 RepID=UPI000AD62DE1|nr:CpaF family protein [uncultured Maritimibacter sp.]